MFIDIHVHTKEFSPCSHIDLEEAIIKAKTIGLDGICITDHESMEMINRSESLTRKHQFLLIVGVELLTYEGDLLVFGLHDVPSEKMHANDLIRLTSQERGVCISAHPFRDNGRGMGEYIRNLEGLAGIETFNGNTKLDHNKQAHVLGKDLRLPCLGGSDAHRVERVGMYATSFPDGIKDLQSFIEAIKVGQVCPVGYQKTGFRKINTQNSWEV